MRINSQTGSLGRLCTHGRRFTYKDKLKKVTIVNYKNQDIEGRLVYFGKAWVKVKTEYRNYSLQFRQTEIIWGWRSSTLLE